MPTRVVAPSTAILLLALVFSPPGLAQSPVLAITGATLFDGSGSPPISNAVVVIQDGQITAVGPQASLVPSAGGVQVVGGSERTFARETRRVRGFLVVDPTEGTAFVRGQAAWNLRGSVREMVIQYRKWDRGNRRYHRELHDLVVRPTTTDFTVRIEDQR